MEKVSFEWLAWIEEIRVWTFRVLPYVVFKSAGRAFSIRISYFHCNSCLPIVLSTDVTRIVVLMMCGVV